MWDFTKRIRPLTSKLSEISNEQILLQLLFPESYISHPPPFLNFFFDRNRTNILHLYLNLLIQVREKKRHRSKSGSKSEHRRSVHGGNMAASVSADDFTNHQALATEPPLPSRDHCSTPRDSLPPLPPLGRDSNSAPRDIPTPRDHSMTTPPRDPISSPREPMPLPREAKGMSPPPLSQPTTDLMPLSNRGVSEMEGMAQFLRKALRIEGPQLNPKTVTIRWDKSF